MVQARQPQYTQPRRRWSRLPVIRHRDSRHNTAVTDTPMIPRLIRVRHSRAYVTVTRHATYDNNAGGVIEVLPRGQHYAAHTIYATILSHNNKAETIRRFNNTIYRRHCRRQANTPATLL